MMTFASLRSQSSSEHLLLTDCSAGATYCHYPGSVSHLVFACIRWSRISHRNNIGLSAIGNMRHECVCVCVFARAFCFGVSELYVIWNEYHSISTYSTTCCHSTVSTEASMIPWNNLLVDFTLADSLLASCILRLKKVFFPIKWMEGGNQLLT